MSTDPLGGYVDLAELEADLRAAEARWAAAAPWRAPALELPPGRTYDVGINCPRDQLQARLDEARRRAR